MGWAADVYRFYPVGTISVDAVYQTLDQQRADLRACHQQYLKKIPGGFDDLGVEFQINPQGKAHFFANPSPSKPKDKALACIKSVLGSLTFPRPKYGVVFVRFDSDLTLQQSRLMEDQRLSRNAVSLVPYMPQKMIEAQIEMYMPYYQPCFDGVEKNKRPALIELAWHISDSGLPEDIQVTANGASSQVLECVRLVTEQHRYPSGFARTHAKRSFRVR